MSGLVSSHVILLLHLPGTQQGVWLFDHIQGLVVTPSLLWNLFTSTLGGGAVGKVWVSGLDLSKVKVLSFSEPQLTELWNGSEIMTAAIIVPIIVVLRVGG